MLEEERTLKEVIGINREETETSVEFSGSGIIRHVELMLTLGNQERGMNNCLHGLLHLTEGILLKDERVQSDSQRPHLQLWSSVAVRKTTFQSLSALNTKFSEPAPNPEYHSLPSPAKNLHSHSPGRAASSKRPSV